MAGAFGAASSRISAEVGCFESQQEARIEVFSRRPAGQWKMTEFVGLETECRLDSIQCSVPLAEIYSAGVLD